MKAPLTISHIDHIVLTVQNIYTTREFYETVLGMTVETFNGDRVALKFGTQKINLHEYGKEFEPKATSPIPGSQDMCFIIDTPIDIAMEHVKSKGINILDGPVQRTGAQGPIMSFYIRDPDGNLIEISNYIEHQQ